MDFTQVWELSRLCTRNLNEIVRPWMRLQYCKLSTVSMYHLNRFALAPAHTLHPSDVGQLITHNAILIVLLSPCETTSIRIVFYTFLDRSWKLAEESLWNSFMLGSITLQQKYNLCVSRKGIARHQPNFHIHVFCERFIYSQDRSTYIPAAE